MDKIKIHFIKLQQFVSGPGLMERSDINSFFLSIVKLLSAWLKYDKRFVLVGRNILIAIPIV